MPAYNGHFTINDNQGYQALDTNTIVQSLASNGVQTGCKVSIDTGNLGSSNSTLSIASGEIRYNGSMVSVPSQSVGLKASDNQPRKDVVYLDGNGNKGVRTGKPAAPEPETEGVMTERPAPNDFDDILSTGVILYEIWVPADVTAVTKGNLYDRRLPPTATFAEQTDAETLDGLSRSEFALDKRTFSLQTGSNSDWIHVAKLTSSGGAGRIVCDLTFDAAVGTGDRRLTMYVSIYDNSANVTHYTAGRSNNTRTHLVVTKTSGGEGHLYARTTGVSNARLRTVAHPDHFGAYDYTDGLASSDAIGSVVYDTGDRSPSANLDVGTVNASENVTVGGNDVLTTADEGSINAGQLDGVDSSSFARTDEPEIFNRQIAFANNSALTNPLGTSDEELFRMGTDFGDLVAIGSGGAGRFDLAYNAELKSGTWSYGLADPASLIKIHTDGSLQFKTAPAGSAGGTISWNTATISGGSIDNADMAVDSQDGEDIHFSVDVDKPPAPSSGKTVWFDIS